MYLDIYKSIYICVCVLIPFHVETLFGSRSATCSITSSSTSRAPNIQLFFLVLLILWLSTVVYTFCLSLSLSVVVVLSPSLFFHLWGFDWMMAASEDPIEIFNKKPKRSRAIDCRPTKLDVRWLWRLLATTNNKTPKQEFNKRQNFHFSCMFFCYWFNFYNKCHCLLVENPHL